MLERKKPQVKKEMTEMDAKTDGIEVFGFTALIPLTCFHLILFQLLINFFLQGSGKYLSGRRHQDTMITMPSSEFLK